MLKIKDSHSKPGKEQGKTKGKTGFGFGKEQTKQTKPGKEQTKQTKQAKPGKGQTKQTARQRNKGFIMDKKQVLKTARLARLKLSEKEQAQFADQLKTALEYFRQISSVDTQGIEPLVYPLDDIEPARPFREDTSLTPQNTKELLNLAPELLGNEYKVPPVVE